MYVAQLISEVGQTRQLSSSSAAAQLRLSEEPSLRATGTSVRMIDGGSVVLNGPDPILCDPRLHCFQ